MARRGRTARGNAIERTQLRALASAVDEALRAPTLRHVQSVLVVVVVTTGGVDVLIPSSADSSRLVEDAIILLL
jgi:hypothetical protein